MDNISTAAKDAFLRLLAILGFCYLLAAAAFIEYGAARDLPYAVAAQDWRLLQWHFLANAGFMLIKYLADRRERDSESPTAGLLYFVLGIGPLVYFGAIDLCLAGSLLFDFSPQRLWLASLALPGVAGFIITFTYWGTKETPPQEAEPEAEEEFILDSPDEQDDKEPNYGSEMIRAGIDNVPGGSQNRTRLFPHLISTLQQVLGLIVGIAFLAAGVLHFLVLRDLILNGSSMLAGEIAELALAVLIVSVPYILIYGGIFAVMAVITGIVLVSIERVHAGKAPDYDRELTEHDYRYLENAFNEIVDYAFYKAAFPKWYGWMYMPTFIVLMLLCMGLCMLAAALLMYFVNGMVEPHRTAGHDVIIYAGQWFTGVMAALFCGIMLVWYGYARFVPRWPHMMEYLYIQQGWNTTQKEPRSQKDFLPPLVRLYRARRIDGNEPFDVRQFIHLAYTEFLPIIGRATLGCFGLVLVLTLLDVRSYHMITTEGIEYVRWYKPGKTELTFAEVDHVEIACYEGEDDGDLELRLAYDIHLPDGSDIDILDNNPSSNELQQLEEADALLRRAGIAVNRHEGDRYDPACKTLLLGYLGENRGNRLANLLGAD